MQIRKYNEELKIVQKTITILNRYSKLYTAISDGKFERYEEYIRVGFGDEDELIKPKLWLDFMHEILGFPKDEYIPEHPEKSGLTPDFTPRDLRAHSFVFEIKSSNCAELSLHYSQLQDYIKPPVKWGIITNMRQLAVYEKDFPTPIGEYSFDFLILFKTYKSQPKKVLDYDNTKRFLNFVERFRFRELSLVDKIEKIKEALPWTGDEQVDPDALIQSIRKIVGFLHEDIKDHREHLASNLHHHPRVQDEFCQEIETIAWEIDRKRIRTIPNAELLKTFLTAKLGSVEYQAVEIYLMRIAYFTMTRIIIARMWEDIGFLEQVLYDGGFKKWYETLNREIRRVLEHAFAYAGTRYSWLYNVPNNYSWYTPEQETLTEVLYELSKYNLGKLNTDVLGTVYEEYVERIDRKNKGQYYTPREIINLIWDLVGYNNEQAFFKYENGKRIHRLVYDPAVGSAGFLVEAARRIQEISKYNDKEFDDLYEIFYAITDGLYGSEISIFAYYIAEVNLIIQISPIIKKIRETNLPTDKLPFTLSLINADSLSFHAPQLLGVSDTTAFIKNSKNQYGHKAVADTFKKAVMDKIKETFEFDFICSNPPYIGEKGHKELFRTTIEHYSYWQDYYQGKMDYLYFFIILGLSKLKEGGKLGFITTSYWPMADGASNLRKFILDNALIQTIVDFGETKIFEGAPGQHNMVFVLEKCSSFEKGQVKFPIDEIIEKKNKHQIKIVRVKKIPNFSQNEKKGKVHSSGRNNSMVNHHSAYMKAICECIKKHIDKKKYSNEYIDVFYSAVKQRKLDEEPWNQIWTKVNIDGFFLKVKGKTELLLDVLEPRQGIVPSVDKVTKTNIKYLPDEKIEKEKIQTGDGIFILTQEEVEQLKPSVDERELIIPSYHNAHITSYYVDIPDLEKDYVLYIDKNVNFEDYPSIKKHLVKFKEILQARLDRYGENYPWWRLHRLREKRALLSEKIVVSNWGTSWQSYAYQSGQYFEKRDITFFVKKEGIKESLFYFLGLLNSSLLRWWMTEKARQLGYMRQSLQEQIPIRRIDFNNPEEKRIHDKLVKNVETIIKSKKELAQYNKFFEGVRLTKLYGSEKIPETNVFAITMSLPQDDRRILRTHTKVTSEPKATTDFYLAKIGKTEEVAPLFTKPSEERLFSLALFSMDKKQVSIIAPKEIVKYLGKVLQNYIGKSWDEIKNIPLAKDLKTYQRKEKEIIDTVRDLLTKIKKMQYEIDQIVYDLYAISPEEQKTIEKALKETG